MTQTLTLQEAQTRLTELIVGLPPGDEVVLTENGQPLAKIVKTARTSWPCEPGSAKDKILWISDDFDAPMEEFKEYME